MVVLFVAIMIFATIVPRRNTGHDLHLLTNIPCAINVRYWHKTDAHSHAQPFKTFITRMLCPSLASNQTAHTTDYAGVMHATLPWFIEPNPSARCTGS